MTHAFSWTQISIFHQLIGCRWDDNVRVVVESINPSNVRVSKGGMFHTDAMENRISISINELGLITDIHMEVRIELPEGVDNGHDFKVQFEQFYGRKL